MLFIVLAQLFNIVSDPVVLDWEIEHTKVTASARIRQKAASCYLPLLIPYRCGSWWSAVAVAKLDTEAY